MFINRHLVLIYQSNKIQIRNLNCRISEFVNDSFVDQLSSASSEEETTQSARDSVFTTFHI